MSATHVGIMSLSLYRAHLRLSVPRLLWTVSKSKLMSSHVQEPTVRWTR